MMTSAGSSNHPGGGLFFSFGDDPLLEEDVDFGQMDANIEKLGKATGNNSLNLLYLYLFINYF